MNINKNIIEYMRRRNMVSRVPVKGKVESSVKKRWVTAKDSKGNIYHYETIASNNRMLNRQGLGGW